MEKMQQFLDYIFYKVWCRASVSTPYSFELFNKKYQLKNIIVSFHYDDTKGGDLFNKTIEEVYKIFQTYTKKQKEEVKKWYKSNNNIEQLCINNPNMTAITYNQLALIDLGLSEKFKNFFPKLYGKDIIGLKVIKDVIGNIDSHYEKFIEKNGEGICPFCGINDIDGNYVHTREAYDHYLPKEKYPFNSINFKNLAPMCNKCNSSNKLRQNPILNKKSVSRKAFYPYHTHNNVDINISLTINAIDMNKLIESDIDVNITSISYSEETETWKDIFYITERYQQKCASKAHGKYWYLQIIDECKDDAIVDILRKKYRQILSSPFADNNFLRKPFLEACEAKGLFEDRIE